MRLRTSELGCCIAAVMLVSVAGCSCGIGAGSDGGEADAGDDGGGGTGGGWTDAGEVDAGQLDGGALDAGQVDGGAIDAGELVRVAVAPKLALLAPGSAQVFTATVTGTTNVGVRWALDAGSCGGAAGTLVDGGYTAAHPVEDCEVEVIATSAAEPSASDRATARIDAPVVVIVAPTTVVLGPGGAQTFSATVTGGTTRAVAWSVEPGTCGSAAGSVSDAGVYTAGSPADDCEALVRATSIEDPTKSAAAQVDVVVPLTVGVSPSSATVRTGLTQQFTATVTGGAVLSVTWRVNEVVGGDSAVGTISATGLYTAPALLPVPPVVTVRAVADDDGVTSASAAVTVVPCLGAAVVVNSTVDAVDANVGDGVCADAAGRCTLRAAVREAGACAGADRVALPVGTYTFALPGTGEDLGASGDLDLAGPLELTGAGAATTILDAAGLDRVVQVHGGTVTLSDLTIKGGALGDGAGILNWGTLTLERCVVTGNSSQWTDGAGHGGGIYNAGGTLTVRRTLVEGNAAQVGGGIYSTGPLTLVESTVRGNLVNGGGCAFGGIGNSGGGLALSPAATTTIVRSTISGNSAPETCFGSGGGAGINSDAALVLVNSTVSGNSSAVAGGGIRTSWWGSGSLSLVNCTIAGNSAPSAAALSIGVPTTMANTIVAHQAAGASCSGSSVTSRGHNLDGDGSCALAGTGDVSSVSAGLGPLADNGGPTLTHALLAGSPAIDQGDDAICAAAPVGGVDQRGQARPTDGDGSGTAVCDRGAFEAPKP